MDFIGTGRRLEQGDVGAAARTINVSTAALLAVMEVEARGRGFDSRRRPIILYEPHRFYAELGAGAKRDRAVREGLAYRRWGTQPYPRGSDAQYARLTRAMRIDRDAALKACSWGLPQILGSNHRDAGFAAGPLPMVSAMMRGEREQLDAMCRLIKAWGLDAAMRDFGRSDRRGERAFARRYNGPGYAKNDYHTKIGRAFAKHSAKGIDMATTKERVAILRLGMKGEAVRGLQADLAALGHDPGPIDGRFGPLTKTAVEAVQEAFGLSVDGIAGPRTLASLDAAVRAINVPTEGEGDAWAEREDDISDGITDHDDGADAESLDTPPAPVVINEQPRPAPADAPTTHPATKEPAMPAPIEHNGGPPRDKSLTPVEQANKAVGAGTWTALAGAIWTVLVSSDVLPATMNTPEMAAAVLTVAGAVAAAIGAYRAPDKRFQG